ncbi:DUF6233 domain-containing protein [Streptomyces lydicus]|uniref:DUF6233 domain-containing protein n=1 Tax=Streptomyces lydicus TaxID=47763 RepID=UPI0037F75871
MAPFGLLLGRLAGEVAVGPQARQRGQPAADWIVQLSVGSEGHPVAVHVSGCGRAGRRARPISRDQTMRALASMMEACVLCRPDTDLGVL